MRDLVGIFSSSESNRRLAELEELLHDTLQELTDALGYERAFVALVHPDRGVVHGAVGVNVPYELLEGMQQALEDEPSILVQSFRSGRALRVEDLLRDPRIAEGMRPIYASLGMVSMAVVPLVPASSVLVVSRSTPIGESEVNQLLPYAGRLIATAAERVEAGRRRESYEPASVEAEWLWWMVNATHDPVLLTNDQNEIVIANLHAERLFQAGPDAGEGERRAIALNNSLLSVVIGSYAIDQGRGRARELTLVDPIEGNELLYELICQTATNLRTGERGLVSVLKDVTDLRGAAEQVTRTLAELQSAGEDARQESNRLNLILENVANPIVVTNQSGQIVLMNQPAERLLQGGEEPVDERRAAIRFANDAKLGSFLSQLSIQQEPLKQGEIQLVDPVTEMPLMMSVTATEVRDELGQMTATVSVLQDLTTIRELERRMVEQQLFESEKLAAVGRLAATVAHEINNPLEAIINALYLVSSRMPVDDPNRRFLDIASKETARVSGIIRQMLGFYRPTASATSTDVNQILEETIALLERQFRQHKVTLKVELDGTLPRVMASGDQLKQVFLNLFLNSQEAMPGGGTLHVSTRLSRETDTELLAGRYVVIQLRDTGSGIAEDHLQHIFEPFYSTKRDSKGTGLGLWVSQGIVHNYGGQIKVQSRPGRGTTFTIAFPPEDGQ